MIQIKSFIWSHSNWPY